MTNRFIDHSIDLFFWNVANLFGAPVGECFEPQHHGGFAFSFY